MTDIVPLLHVVRILLTDLTDLTPLFSLTI